MRRLFFALWPDAITRQKLALVNESIDLAGVRKLKPSNLHVTLAFLGNVEDDVQDHMMQKVARLHASSFTFQLDGIEHWQTPKTICLTASRQPQALHYLVSSLVGIIKQYPIFLHDRPYCAHVTLMRKAKVNYELTFKPITWKAKQFVLVESISTPDGIVYEILERWFLKD